MQEDDMDSGQIGSKPEGLWPGQNLRSYIKCFVLYIKKIVHSKIKVFLKTITLFSFFWFISLHGVCEINKSTVSEVQDYSINDLQKKQFSQFLNVFFQFPYLTKFKNKCFNQILNCWEALLLFHTIMVIAFVHFAFRELVHLLNWSFQRSVNLRSKL